MNFYNGDKFPAWQGNILAGGLRGQQVARLEVDGDRVIHQEVMKMDYPNSRSCASDLMVTFICSPIIVTTTKSYV